MWQELPARIIRSISWHKFPHRLSRHLEKKRRNHKLNYDVVLSFCSFTLQVFISIQEKEGKVWRFSFQLKVKKDRKKIAPSNIEFCFNNIVEIKMFLPQKICIEQSQKICFFHWFKWFRERKNGEIILHVFLSSYLDEGRWYPGYNVASRIFAASVAARRVHAHWYPRLDHGYSFAWAYALSHAVDWASAHLHNNHAHGGPNIQGPCLDNLTSKERTDKKKTQSFVLYLWDKKSLDWNWHCTRSLARSLGPRYFKQAFPSFDKHHP